MDHKFLVSNRIWKEGIGYQIALQVREQQIKRGLTVYELSKLTKTMPCHITAIRYDRYTTVGSMVKVLSYLNLKDLLMSYLKIRVLYKRDIEILNKFNISLEGLTINKK